MKRCRRDRFGRACAASVEPGGSLSAKRGAGTRRAERPERGKPTIDLQKIGWRSRPSTPSNPMNLGKMLRGNTFAAPDTSAQMTWKEVMLHETDGTKKIRDAVRTLCQQFPDEYFRKIDEQKAYLRGSSTR